MLLSRDDVESLLDTNSSIYDSSLIVLKTLPKDAIFKVEVEDIVTAEYYDVSKDQIFSFNLDYDYFNNKNTIIEYEDNKIKKDIYDSLEEEKNFIENYINDNSTNTLLVLLVFINLIFIPILVILFILYYYYYYYY